MSRVSSFHSFQPSIFFFFYFFFSVYSFIHLIRQFIRYQTERERQIEQIRERVNRIKNERTVVTPTTPPTHDGADGGASGDGPASFTNMAQGADHDKMEKLAKDMENKFKEAQVYFISDNLTTLVLNSILNIYLLQTFLF